MHTNLQSFVLLEVPWQRQEVKVSAILNIKVKVNSGDCGKGLKAARRETIETFSDVRLSLRSDLWHCSRPDYIHVMELFDSKSSWRPRQNVLCYQDCCSFGLLFSGSGPKVKRFWSMPTFRLQDNLRCRHYTSVNQCKICSSRVFVHNESSTNLERLLSWKY